MNKVLFSLALLLTVFNTYALDEEYSPDIDALFKADLIMTCTVDPGEDFVFHLNPLNILKNTSGIRIKKEDRLEIQGSMWSGFGQKGAGHAAAYVVYLRRYQGKWYTYTYQHHKPLKKGLIPFTVCENQFYLNVRDYRLMRSQAFKCFKQEEICTYKKLISKQEYLKEEKTLPVITAMYDNFNRFCNYWFEEEVIFLEPTDLVPEEDTTIYVVCEEAPDFVDGAEFYYNYMKSALPDSILNNPQGIEGKAYIRFVVEKDSSISYIDIVRSVDDSFKPALIDFVNGLPPIKPGKQRGKPVRSYFTIPVIIRPFE